MAARKATSSKSTAKPGPKAALLPKLKQFVLGLADRYHRALQVVDEALASDNLKDKIWAVDLILKRTPVAEGEAKLTDSTNKKQAAAMPSMTELEALSDTELMARIRSYLKELDP